MSTGDMQSRFADKYFGPILTIFCLKIAEKNRNNYRKLRQELEDLTEKGVMMLYKVAQNNQQSPLS